ncbi:KpsF/GutQ family sugar-phosphate isomerase [Vulgatibacter incomptus]|uniref:Arabinose 5-phosphate isomerase n=1 Tax=Vulgatibacter incomptus TaxID=1391653 RepID=A0A0K1PED1_9BACT|nr:KpsF/GutQ family sugar-phosphate isomerase [Vulgatibacter incomptus]AKU91766.1 Arabinose 5-phosphate isomerase [Vulgatibacter incomptus]
MATRKNPSKTAPKPKTVRPSAPAPRRTRRKPENSPSPHDLVVAGRRVVEAELAAIQSLRPRIGHSFAKAVELILGCTGRLVVTGLGKPGFVAQKISATFASTGTPSLYLHPAEALHGDLGRVTRDDVVLALSNSGRTEEIVRLMGPVERIGAKVIVMTGDTSSPLAEKADIVLDIGNVEEACPLGLAPTASSTVLLVLGDALAMTVLENRPFGNDDYALIHPSGSLGKKVMRVAEAMRQGDSNPVVRADEPLAKAVAVMTQTPGKPGATNVVDKRGRLVGIFTDGDLRRLFERGPSALECTVGEVMCHEPRTVHPEMLVLEAAQVLRDSRIDQVPVVDEKHRPVGLLDVQDLLALNSL